MHSLHVFREGGLTNYINSDYLWVIGLWVIFMVIFRFSPIYYNKCVNFYNKGERWHFNKIF